MLVGHYDPRLVLLSVAIASVAAYVAFDMAGRVAATAGPARRRWCLGGALSMGTGMWAMHYVGMLAFSLPVPVWYDVPTVLGSLLAAMLASGVALVLVSRIHLNAGVATVGGLAMGSGIAGMHYLGMAAMRFQGTHHYDPGMVALSVAVAVVASWVALTIARHFRREPRPFAPMKLAGALVMGLAVTGMHYTGMAAASFMSGVAHGDMSYAVSVSALGTFGVVAVTTMVLALALLSSRIDVRLTAQAEAIRAGEERYRLLFNRSLAGVYQSTLDGRLLDCNDALGRILGFTSGADMRSSDAQHLYAGAGERDRWLDQLREAKSLPDYEHRLKRRDGRLIWVLESASLIDGAEGDAAIIEGTVIDITSRKQAEDEVAAMASSLVASLERYKTLVETTSAIPWEMDGDTLIFRYVSPMIARLFHYSTERAVGRIDVWQRVHDDDRERVQAQFSALARSQAPEGLETEFRIHTGVDQIAYVRSVVAAKKGPGDEGVTLRGVTFDVTEQRRLELDLRQAQKLESVGRLAAGVAHEINTPVQFVSDSVRFARDGMADLATLIACYRAALDVMTPEELTASKALLAEAERSADLDYLLEQLPRALALSMDGLERVGTIVRSMKEFAHPDQSEMAAVDLNRALQSTLIVARNEYRYVADVEVDLGDIPPVTCHGGEINQAVLNILVNAAHAIEEHNRASGDRGKITVRTWRDAGHVVIAIADTGGGIPDAIHGKVFDPFFTTKALGRGTGQGLAIARSVIVDKQGGELTFDSKPGRGSTFYVRLPIDGRPAAGVAA